MSDLSFAFLKKILYKNQHILLLKRGNDYKMLFIFILGARGETSVAKIWVNCIQARYHRFKF